MTLSEVAVAYTLSRPQVAGAIVGAHNAKHLGRLKKLADYRLSDIDRATLEIVLRDIPYVRGGMYELERYDDTHRGIMKVNLNDGLKPL